MNKDDIRWFVGAAVVVWMFTVFMAAVLQIIHNDQEREISKINSCQAAVDVGACLTIAAAAGK